MNLPAGRLVHSRVVEEPGVALAEALDRELTGYATLEPQRALLLDDAGRGVVALRDGVPTLAVHTGSGRGGPAALADLAEPGPYSVEIYEADAADLPDATPERRVPPGMPAERLAGDADLADRTCRAAPADAETAEGASAVEAFLDDEAKIERIRREAREEAERQAAEWGLEGELE
jgi:hypothetical protein